MRKLVTVRTISAIDPIPGADAIEVATVDGWKVVVKKGEYAVGQEVLYFEIDSILPKGVPEFEFLMARDCKEHPADDGTYVLGHRLRTIKLRGQISQGLVIPLPPYWVIEGTAVTFPVAFADDGTPIGYGFETISGDFSDVFGVKKYEKPVAPSMQGVQRGNYPSWLPKTDQERVQNCFDSLPRSEKVWRIEEKVEGSSITIYWNGEYAGVTSRNIDLKLDQEGNTFVDMAKRTGLLEYVERAGTALNKKIAIRGELVGPGIQDNIYKLSDFRIYIYDVWVDDGYLDPQSRSSFLDEMYSDKTVDADLARPVPVVLDFGSIDLHKSAESIVETADGKSLINPDTLREGLVYKTIDTPVISFKAISNAYLMREK